MSSPRRSTTPASPAPRAEPTVDARAATAVDVVAARCLAGDLERAGYTASGLEAALGAESVAALGRHVAVPARQTLRTLGDAPLATLVRCLMLGDTVEAQALDMALPSTRIEGAVRLGVIERVDDRARWRIAVRPVAVETTTGRHEWWIASDHDALSGVRPLPHDHVLGVGGASRTLAALVPPGPVDRALDLGSGCGIVTLVLATVAREVVATDLSARACWCTALTAAMNGVRVEVRQGSLLEPVAGEHFDLVASNPPFVITPRVPGLDRFEYRDGGVVGDAIVERLVRDVPGVLAPEGRAVMLGNWESHGDVTGLDRVRGWIGDHAAWVIEREAMRPSAYAELWLRDGGQDPTGAASDDDAAILDAWLADLNERGVTAVGLGWIVLGTDDGPRRLERVDYPVDLAVAGRHLGAAFEAAPAVAALDDELLASARLVVAPDVTEVRHLRPGATGPRVIELRQGGGLARTIEVDTALAAVVGACDGDLDVGTLIDTVADLLDVDATALRADLLPRLRTLLGFGMLTLG